MAEEITVKPNNEILSILKRRMALKSAVPEQETANLALQELHGMIHEAWLEWQNALQNFDCADCKDMVDYYAYRIKASQIRYEYLLRKAKAMQVQ